MTHIKFFETEKEYNEMFDKFPAILDLGSEPFIMRILLTILPDLKQRLKVSILDDLIPNCIPRFTILEMFVDIWIRGELSRLK